MKRIDTYRLFQSIGIKMGISVILWSFFYSSLFSQSVTPAEELEYEIEIIEIPGGQLANNVNCIVQGPNGFVWIGSHGGLHRYDGNEYYTYKNVPSDTIGETTTLSNPYVEHLYWDRYDKLWVCTYGGGLYRYDPMTEEFKHFACVFKDSSTISHPRVLSANEDNKGRLWFGTENGLNLFDRETETFKRYYEDPGNPNSLFDDDIRNIYLDKQGTLWLATGFLWFRQGGGALSKYNPETDDFTNYRISNDGNESTGSAIRGLQEDSKGNFWVGTLAGLRKFDRTSGEFSETVYKEDQPFAPGILERSTNPVYSIMEDSRGGLWIGTIGDLNYPSHITRYDPLTKKSQVLPYSMLAWQMSESSDGTIWVSGAGAGGRMGRLKRKEKTFDLLKFQDLWMIFQESSAFKTLGINRDYSISSIVNIGFDESSRNLWMSFVIYGITKPNLRDAYLVLARSSYDTPEKFDFFPLLDLDISRDASLTGNSWSSVGLEIDEYGSIWTTLTSENVGIVGFNPETKEMTHIAHNPDDSTSLSSNFITQILLDSRGELWATSFNEGLNRVNLKTGEIQNYRFIDYRSFDQNEFPITLLEDLDGKIWAAGQYTDQQDRPFIAVIDPYQGTSEKVYIPATGFISIPTITQSRVTGEIVFSMWGRGLGICDPKTRDIEIYNPSLEDFTLSGIASIVPDKEGNFWISSSNNGNFLKMDSTHSFQLIRGSFPGTATFSRRTTTIDDEKLIYLCGPGYYEIDPDEISGEQSTAPLPTRFIDLYVFGNKIIPGTNKILPTPLGELDQITLPNRAESFGITFSNFNFKNENIEYQYRLYPYEQNWKITRGDARVDYHRLPSGTYTLEVSPIQYSSNSTIEKAELTITVLPPMWRSWWALLLYFIALVLGGWLVHRYQKEKTIRQERERIKDRELAQAKEIEKAYKELQNTQKQLIHAEKMASLGELTAGIAHEIKNPLNFVNNFAEVNSELLAELKEEIKAGNYDEVAEIATDLEQNELKIQHHGKRADSIVKGMLMHSRNSSDEKVATDINALADEYLRLAYHGLRAKDKSFNATMKTEFDPKVKAVDVIPQDFGRVLLNLITNAFHACTERSRSASSEKRLTHSNNGYSPTVTVQTNKTDHDIEIQVSDNGNGIPESIKDKIFQPFFTTKASGEGTGLGLSISYDIITKGHDGELAVASEEGVGTTFTIKIPNRENQMTNDK